jgi:hypothetical protein
MTTHLKTAAFVLLVVLLPIAAVAQGPGEPPSTVRMRIGPLFINPTLNLSNAGRDTNVFNDAKNPQEDFTVTITPATDLWLRFGPTWIQGNIREDIIWFQKFASERSANNTYAVKWVVPLNRLTVTPSWAYADTHERPGFEIDARVEHTQLNYAAAAEYRLFTKTFIGAEGRRVKTDFVDGATFQNTNLHDELNRTSTFGGVNIRHQLTPLTSLNLTGAMSQDRFEFDRLRNSDSVNVSGALRFDPSALIKGGAAIGYRDFKPLSPDLPSYRGSTMAVDLTYILLGMSRFTFVANRDVQYSYDINQPYYLQTSLNGSVSQQIFGPVDVVVRGGVGRLEYRDRAGAVVAVSNRVDRIESYGGGIGYHVGRDMRIGVNLDHNRRDSQVELRQYQGWLYGVSVTYSTGSGS